MAGLRVHHLNCASIRGLSIHGRHLVCHTLLVETPSSGLVLVDAGLGTADYADITSRLGKEFAWGYARPKVDPALAAVNQVRAMGFDPRDVRHIVLTHMDLDHVGGLSDFPHARVHLHGLELKAAMERASFRAKKRYRPLMWAHEPHFVPYDDLGERWFGFEAVRNLQDLPPEILFVPLFGHTHGHSGVAVQGERGWLLHAGDAYFDPREIKQDKRQCAPKVALFQTIVTTNRKQRFYNQGRLRDLVKHHPEIDVFCAHNPHEFPGDPLTPRTRPATLQG
ncbi:MULTISPECIES: MBL fold metallo-hydrolase [unclassified Streptomyces]|uniref:MBL fold metallo-hydrolase n=1 Tax=unclassified Streptomyces TaxID=2593676 RepID=UPI003818B2D8